MTKIKFGTDGWRAIIAKDFTTDNVARVTQATATWLNENFENPSVVIGHDCRFAGELFAQTAAIVMAVNGVKVKLAKDFVSTPMISLGANKLKTSLGIIITASHNPPSYNGFKLKGGYGGPLLPLKVQEIEDLIKDENHVELDTYTVEDFQKKGLIEYTDLESMYVEHVEANFDLDSIRNSGLELAFDAMFGSGQNVMRRLFPDITFLHCDYNPSFEGQAPEPIHKNLLEFSETIKMAGNIDCGLAVDGDADRIGLYDSKGNFIDSHHIILLLIHYLVKYKGLKGKVCTAFSTTVKIKKMCKHYGLELEVVKIGFKYICEIMLKEDVLIGGEESGGIAVKGHIPERDGIWMGMVIWEYMAKSGKSLNELIEEVYEITGKFAFERSDLHLNEEIKNKIVNNCRNNNYSGFGNYKIERTENLDGYKYFFNDDEWLMIRASGTEPVLRTYAESETREKAFEILKTVEKHLLENLTF
ncbi:MAG: phosphoglucomutase/phosphomannomutase family protein [Bacteroidetes bacterium]|nr:phosphoglucomutase/phosphomannomutase family protein [Bacteroidota bacterium]HET6244288.1 phosphoglucomutase/phosphomannomutase family protein [Bacteroidia bacterium]